MAHTPAALGPIVGRCAAATVRALGKPLLATDHGTITGRQSKASKNRPVPHTRHESLRQGGGAKPTDVFVSKKCGHLITVLLLVNSIYTPTLVSRVCVEASRGARHFEVAHATRATLRRSLLAASARTG